MATRKTAERDATKMKAPRIETGLHLSRNYSTGLKKSDSIIKKDYKEIDYDNFFWKYLELNLPLVLTNVTENWECVKAWLKMSSKHKSCSTKSPSINFRYLKKKIGNVTVIVDECKMNSYAGCSQKNMSFFEFLDYWASKKKTESKKIKDKVKSTSSNREVDEDSVKTFYIKSWPLQAQMPNYEFYKVPNHFRPDWLDEFPLKVTKDRLRFVSMCPKDSWEPFRTGAFGTFTWIASIIGHRKYILVPSGESLNFIDETSSLPGQLSESDLDRKNVQYYVVEQFPNDAIFIPSGWHFQVLNVSDTITVTHGWVNVCNLQRVWNQISCCMKTVLAENKCDANSQDENYYQRLVQEKCGMNIFDFVNMLEHIDEQRLKSTPMLNPSPFNLKIKPKDHEFNNNVNQFELKCICEVAFSILSDTIFDESRMLLYKRIERVVENTNCKFIAHKN